MSQSQPKIHFSWPLLTSPFVSQLGSMVYLLGLNWILVKATGSTALLGTIEGIGGIAFLAGDLLVGVLVDNGNRKKVLIGTDLFAALACLAGALLVTPHHPQTWLLILVTSVLDMMNAINYPAAKAIIPEIITRDSRQRFNALANTTFNLANVLAPLVGGLLLGLRGITFQTFLFINSLSFILGVILNALMTYHYQPQTQPTHWWAGIIGGLKYVWAHPDLVSLIIAMAIFNFLYAGINLVQPYIGTHYFGGQASNYSLLLTLIAIGGVLGGVSMAWQRRQVTIQQLIFELLISGAILTFMGLWLTKFTWLAGSLLYGIIQARFSVNTSTLIQAETAINYLGSVFGLSFLAFDGVQPFGSLIFGYLIPVFKQLSFSVFGLLTLIAFGLLLIMTRRFTTN